MTRVFSFFFFFFCMLTVNAQQFEISGNISFEGENVEGASIALLPKGVKKMSSENGYFVFKKLQPGTYELVVTRVGTAKFTRSVTITDKNIAVSIELLPLNTKELSTVVVTATNNSASGKLKQIEGTAIYAGKKTEVINMANVNANLATNNSRQVYARIAGLNIWENDGGGLQLGIGGRGLNPSRVSNFNTRQNGYDISADALGYPESYYSPANEAIDRIEIVRGAAGLQYGTQFGGMINFQLKKGPVDKKIQFTSRQTVGSFGFFNSFNSIGGTVKKLNYYAYYQYKRGDSWRPNSHFDQQSAYIHLDYDFTKKLKLTAEYTYMNYLAQQPGGLTDDDFNNDPSISVRARNWFHVNWNLANITLDYQFSKNTKLNWRSYTLQAGRDAIGILKNIQQGDPGGDRNLMTDKYENYGSEIRLLHQYQLVNKKISSLLVGVRVYKGLTIRKQGDGDAGSDATFKFTSADPNNSSYRFPGTNIAFFTENIFQLTDKWSITPGTRFEYISTNADGYYTTKASPFPPFVYIKNDEHKKNNRSFVFFGVGSAYKFSNGIELYANISQNYRSINFNDIRVLNPSARVDSMMKDETGYTADGGVRGKIKNWLYFDASIFYLKYNNRIGSVNKRDEDFFSYRLRTNVADSRNIGFESLVDIDILNLLTHGRAKYKLGVYTNFSIIDARYFNSKDSSIRDNNYVEFVPPILFRTGISFGNKRFNITWQYSHVGKQYSDATNAILTPNAVDGLVPAYNVMDISVSYNWKWLSLFGSINNVTNQKYFTRRADGYPGPGILPSDPIGYYLTLQVKL